MWTQKDTVASFYVYIVFLILRQTCRFFFDVCMLVQWMQLLMKCNVLNAMKVDAVNTGVKAFTQAYRAPHPSRGEAIWKAFHLVDLVVHQSEKAALF